MATRTQTPLTRRWRAVILCGAGLTLSASGGCKFLADEFYYVDRAPVEQRGDPEARVAPAARVDREPGPDAAAVGDTGAGPAK